MTQSYQSASSCRLRMQRALRAGALALGIAGPTLLVSGLTRAADQPAPPAPAAHGGERHERFRDDLVRDALRLTPEQQRAWQAIRAKREALRSARRHEWAKVRQALETELAQPEPDLARVAALREHAADRALRAHKEIEDMRLKLYASFSPEQKAVVRDFLKLHLARHARWHEHAPGPHPARPGGHAAPEEGS